MTGLVPHEFCLLPDAFDAIEMAKLESSMREIGWMDGEFITLFEDKILDGWHRYQAANTVGVTPEFKQFNGTRKDAVEFCYFKLFARRHVDKGKKAAIALRFAKHREENGGVKMTHEEIAVMANVSKPYVSQAASVEARDPGTLTRVINNELSLPRAYKELARSIPEKNTEHDPLFDVWTTKEKWKLVIARLQELGDRDIDPLFARRGSEVINETFQSIVRIEGKPSLGKTFIGTAISRIKANMPHCPCEECHGAQCQVCSFRGWWTAAEARSRSKKL